MPTCECGYKESGRYFKGKVCPKCNEPQFPKNISSAKKKKVLFSEESFVKQEQKEIEPTTNFNGLLTKPTIEKTGMIEEYSIPELQPDLAKLESIEKSSINKIVLSADEWKLLTIEIYTVAHEMLRELNPEYYDSKTAQKLRDLNAKLSSIVLSSKEVNPIRILLFTNLLYVLPALKGIVPKRKRKKEKEEKETIIEKPKRDRRKSSNEEFYDE